MPRILAGVVALGVGLASLVWIAGGEAWLPERSHHVRSDRVRTRSKPDRVPAISAAGVVDTARSDGPATRMSGEDHAELASRAEEPAQNEPEAAAIWALNQPAEKRLDAVAAVLIGAAKDSDERLRLAARFCRDDPVFIREHGSTLITVLVANGEFRAAEAFAEMGGPERPAWMRTTFSQWARADLAAAAQAAVASDDAEAIAAVTDVSADTEK